MQMILQMVQWAFPLPVVPPVSRMAPGAIRHISKVASKVAPSHCRCNKKGIKSLLGCSFGYRPFVRSLVASEKGPQHADYDAEGSIDYPATAWTGRDNPERSPGHRRIAERSARAKCCRADPGLFQARFPSRRRIRRRLSQRGILRRGGGGSPRGGFSVS